MKRDLLLYLKQVEALIDLHEYYYKARDPSALEKIKELHKKLKSKTSPLRLKLLEQQDLKLFQ